MTIRIKGHKARLYNWPNGHGVSVVVDDLGIDATFSQYKTVTPRRKQELGFDAVQGQNYVAWSMTLPTPMLFGSDIDAETESLRHIDVFAGTAPTLAECYKAARFMTENRNRFVQ